MLMKNNGIGGYLIFRQTHFVYTLEKLKDIGVVFTGLDVVFRSEGSCFTFFPFGFLIDFLGLPSVPFAANSPVSLSGLFHERDLRYLANLG